MLRAIRSAVAVAALGACSASSSAGGAAPTQACAPEDVVAGDGSCVAPGVPPDGCDPGFTYDGNGGCDPILPATPCGEGEMAVPGDTRCYAVGAAGDPPTCPSGQVALPGETACHELADCGSGTWGNIPVDAMTEYVDASYAGGASDGSAGKPWTTIGAAVTAAAAAAIVAVAAGSYAESVTISGKAVRLWGRCPSMVEIVGGAGAAAVSLGAGSDGTEVHTIALTGAGGASLGSAQMVVVDSVWVHDTAGDGVDILGSAVVHRSLVERATNVAMSVVSASVSIDTSVVRDTAPGQGGSGFGIQAEGGSVSVMAAVFERNADAQLVIFGADAAIDGCVIRDALPNRNFQTNALGVGAQLYMGHRARLTVLASTLERNATAALFAHGGDVFVGSTLIRDTQPETSDQEAGHAILAQPDPSSSEASSVTATRSLFERSHSVAAVAFGGNLTLDHCVVRDTLPQASDGTAGVGVQAQDDASTKLRTSLTVTGSLVERNRSVGLSVLGSSGTVSATLVRDTLPRESDGTFGHGIGVAADLATTQKAALALTGSVVTGNRELGVACAGADLVMDRSVVSWTRPGSQGDGIGVYSGLDGTNVDTPRGTLAIARSLVANVILVGVSVDHTDATISQTWIHGVTASPLDGTFGDGVLVQRDAVVTASSCRIENAARAGLSMFGTAQVTLGNATLACDTIPLDGEEQSSLTNDGNLVCSCAGSTTACQVVSSDLQPPPPIGQVTTPVTP